MNLFLKLLFPHLSRSLYRLGQTVGKFHPTQHRHHTMSNITTAEEITIIDAAVAAIQQLKQALNDAVQSLTPLADDNLALRDTIRQLESEDAASDAALARLRDLVPSPVPAGTEPTPEPDTGEVPADTSTGVDPIDPSAPAPEAPAPEAPTAE